MIAHCSKQRPSQRRNPYSAIAVSDSGETLWLAVGASPELHARNSTSLALTSSVPFSSPALGPDDSAYVDQLEVVPGTENFILAGVKPRGELISIVSGTELPGTYSAFPARQLIAIADSQTAFVSDGTRIFETDLVELSIDVVNGLSIRNTFSGFLEALSARELYFSDDELIAARGRVFDSVRQSVSGRYGDTSTTTTGFVSHGTSNRIYAIANGTQLHIYRKDSRFTYRSLRARSVCVGRTSRYIPNR